MSIELYPSVAKVKRGGVYQNLPGFVPESGTDAAQAMIANEETSSTAQYAHVTGSYFRLNGTLYEATADIRVNDAIVVGTNCKVAVLGNDVAELKNEVTSQSAKIEKCVTSELMQKCELVEAPKSANLWNPEAVQVGMVHTNGNTYTGSTYDGYRYYDIGSIEAGSVIHTYYPGRENNASRVVFFDSNGAVMSSDSKSDVSVITVPSGAVKTVITAPQSVYQLFMVLIGEENVPFVYIPYREATSYYVAGEEFIPSALVTNIIKDQSGFVNPRNTTFFYISKNLVDPSTIVAGEYVNQTNGSFGELNTQNRTDYVPVEAGKTYCFRERTGSDGDTTFIRYVFYTANKGYITGAYTMLGDIGYVLTAPANAAYLVISYGVGAGSTLEVMICESNEKVEYEAYDNVYVYPKYIVDAEEIEINLPANIYALVGYELNIYFENIAEDWTRYQWDVACTKGMQLERGYRITPTADDVGTYTLSITAKRGSVTKTANTILNVIAASAGSGQTKSVMVLGDSTTNNGIAVTKLNENFSTDAMNIVTIGTRGTAPNKHEGRSGWRFTSYFAPPNAGDIASGVENPWYNPSTETFDAAYYFANSGVANPDWFFINLGINDMFGYANDTSLADQIDYCKTLCDSMISSMNSASPNTKIGVCLTIPPNHSQDAFGKAYANGQTRDRYKRNNFLWVNALIAEYDGRESEGIYVIPIYVNLDTVYNMGLEELPVNARNTSVTYQSPIANGGVHPVESGYWQIADVYTAFLKANA